MARRRRLLFKKEYGEGILKGTKTSTIRLSSTLKKGDEVEIVAGRVKLGVARIEDVEVKKVKELTDEDAHADGFKSKEELMRALKRIYGRKISEGTEVKLIRFKMLGNSSSEEREEK